MIVDIHTQIGKRKGLIFLVDELIKMMDDAGVEKSVVFSFPENIDNKYVYESVKNHPDRLIGFATINPWAEDAEKEFSKCLNEFGFKGLWLHPIRHGYVLDDHFLLDPILSICSDQIVPVLVYGAATISTIPNHVEEMSISFPEVPLIIAHMGYMYETNSAISVAKQQKNVYVETAGVFVKQIQNAINALGPEKVISGSNVPYDDFSFAIEKVKIATNDEKQQDLILGGNTMRLIGK